VIRGNNSAIKWHDDRLPDPLPLSTMSPSKEKAAGLNPRTTSYEFLGPPGAFLVSTTVPLVTYSLHFGCNETTGCPPPWAIENFKERVISSVTDVEWWKGLWDSQAAVAYLGWYTFVVLAWAILPGDWISGTQLRNGKRLQYKINGVCAFLFVRFTPLTMNSLVDSAPRFGHRRWPHLP